MRELLSMSTDKRADVVESVYEVLVDTGRTTFYAWLDQLGQLEQLAVSSWIEYQYEPPRDETGGGEAAT